MARETKVGLLAGLAFIVCFAVILANRGREEPPATHLSYNVDLGDTLSPGARDRPSQASAREQRSAQAQVTTPTDKPANGHEPNQHVQRTTPPAGTNGSNVVLPTDRPASESVAMGSARTPPQRIPDARRSDTDATSLSAVTAPAGNPALTSPTAEQRERQRALQEHLAGLDAGAGRQDTPGQQGSSYGPPASLTQGSGQTPPPPVRERGSTRSSTASSRKYATKPGDTLTGIAAAHYGRPTPTVINAIFEANGGILSDPDTLPVNVELVLPSIPGIAPSTLRSDRSETSGQSRPSARSADDRTSTGTESFRWYQIRKNDRYISIAREQLGDASRWREIYALNKEKFPDPQRIREGVRIKLPSASTAIAQGQQR